MDDSISTGKITREDLRLRIRESGLKVTLPRLEILSLLAMRGGHHSVDALHQQLLKKGVSLPRASVYNAIRDFVEHRLVQEADAGAGRAYYEFATDWHHHFVCRECGSIQDVPCAVGEKPCLEAVLPGYVIDEAQIIFRGLCPDCKCTCRKS